MVDISEKTPSRRIARAQAVVVLGEQVMCLLAENDIQTKKGPVFQSAIIAGVMGAKKTSDLIPLCHPIPLEDCQVSIVPNRDEVVITTSAVTTSKTGVEMEALTAASVAALTVYDMCKAIGSGIRIKEIRLLEKRGGKTDYVASTDS